MLIPCVLSSLILPALFTWHIAVGGAFFHEFGDGYTPNYIKFAGIRNSLYLLIIVFSVCGVTFIVNSYTIIYIVRHKANKNNWPEIKLFFMSLSGFVIHLFQGILQVFFNLL
ncbi:hypothetical protein L596_024797 [Steinernema carpocapsae]|uniref:Serpentine receptor class gamma n=1 Tax=Steinernema carpocapsae TaxID=34508 RepID=A0A4U5M5T5_STECR|nr:hypothetical protein L596_024797 [Steinernema carpocapsae]